MSKKEEYSYEYPHPCVTVDCVIFGYDYGDVQSDETKGQDEDEKLKKAKKLKVLLVKRGEDPYEGDWALPGGFMKIDEIVEKCAERELEEETGVKGAHVRQFRVYSAVDRDPRERVVTVVFYALLKSCSVEGGSDAVEARWWSIEPFNRSNPFENFPRLAFDHDKILRDTLSELRKQVRIEPIVFELLPKQFTLQELQNLYEAIWGRHLDRRNFYKEMVKRDDVARSDRRVGRKEREKLVVRVNKDLTARPYKYEFDWRKFEELRDNGEFVLL